MPQQQQGGPRGRASAGSSSRKAALEEESSDEASSDPFDSGKDDATPQRRRQSDQAANREGNDTTAAAATEKTIPKNLLTRILHDLFEKDATRVSRDANAAVGKYVDVFVREAIARTAVEKRTGFLEVEDLEKIAPQLLLDL